ncbi:MAG: Oxygen regulatory protein NreC [Firmicutes bacterium ADurb.Bin373]|nr:MAG: Oxygen regulatory protein NreC [Firmicutes bacterium ADurb.Bin373]
MDYLQDQMQNKTRILIVDDHPIVREGLIRLINRQPDLLVCEEAETVADALAAIVQGQPDLTLLDLILKDRSGLDLIKDVQARYPQHPILVLSMQDESMYAERVLRAGARGYIMKQEGTDNLIQAIRQVLRGEIYLSDKMSSQLLNRFASGPGKLPPATEELLSDRELEVFELIGRGLGTREIAQRLFVSIKTVETYRANIKQKLKLQNAPELAHRAFQWVQSQTGK